MKTRQIGRTVAIGGVTGLLMLCGAIAAGLRINGTHSFPVGLYLVRRKSPEIGDLVFVKPPALPIFTLAKERGYLNVAYSAAPHLLKRLAGIAGDRVTIDSTGVQVNRIRLANSVPCKVCLLKDYVLRPNEVLPMSDYNRASFDSRYFGPLQATTIESVMTPLLTWN